MKITNNEIKRIINTLPIGLYCGRRIEISLSEGEETSYYNPLEDNICISHSIIKAGLENVIIDETYTKETAIRSMLYHEVSHAILTPSRLMTCAKDSTEKHILNIFEDERIETLLKDFYLDTNFKKQLLYINGGSVPVATNNLEKFYCLVRFRLYKDLPFAKRVDEIISKYKYLNLKSDRSLYRQYYFEVMKLYNNFCDSCPSDSTSEERKEVEESFGQGDNSSGSALCENNKKSERDKLSEEVEDENSESIGLSLDDENGALSLTKEEMKDIAEKVFQMNINNEVYTTLDGIIAQFNKKNSGGSGMVAYSGVFNPRNCTRNDYRFFERSCTVNGNNRYGNLHLNLFLDDSGSFASNDNATNEIINALNKIESKNKNFTFDVYFIAEGIRKAETKKERYIHSCNGNWLVSEIFDTFRKAQLPNSYNYNIVLFDGDAFSYDVCGEIKEKADTKKDLHNFRAFDTINTTIISDGYNQKYIKKDVTSARVIYTSDYVNELSSHIANALLQGFR